MYLGSSAASVLVGVVGGVLLVCAVILVARLGARRSVGVAGLGLLLLGLSLSGLIEVVVRALTLFTFNPLRWVGLAAAVVGLVMLSVSGMLPRRGRRERAGGGSDRAVEAKDSGRGRTPAMGDDEMADIEEILRRRGIT